MSPEDKINQLTDEKIQQVFSRLYTNVNFQAAQRHLETCSACGDAAVIVKHFLPQANKASREQVIAEFMLNGGPVLCKAGKRLLDQAMEDLAAAIEAAVQG